MTPLYPQTILIVDDTPEDIAALTEMLQKAYHLRHVPNSTQSLELLNSSQPPDLILLNTGLVNAANQDSDLQLLKQANLKGVPVLLVRQPNENVLLPPLGIEGSEFITKPFVGEEIETRVRTALTLRKLRQQLTAQTQQVQHSQAQLNQMQPEEEPKDQPKNRFFSMIAHDLRTPLSVVHSSARLLKHYGSGVSEAKRVRHLHNIEQSAAHLSNLLDNLLFVEQCQSGSLQFTPHPVDLIVFCQEIVTHYYRDTEGNHKINLSYDNIAQKDRLPAQMDVQLLNRIVRNLLANALTRSSVNGQIDLKLAVADEHVHMIISDEGIGIAADVQAQLADLFNQTGPVRTVSGTGLGLFAVKQAVELHGGTIMVESQPAVGTTFTIKLPMTGKVKRPPLTLSPPPNQNVSEPSDKSNQDTSIEQIEVLIVEDFPMLREGVKKTLARSGRVKVIGEATNGFEAIEQSRVLQPDVILMDLVMPRMGGIEAIKKIKQDDPHMHILVLTSTTDEDMVFPAIKAGALGYLLKDASPKELLEAIETVNRGESSLHPAIARMLVQEISEPTVLPPTEHPLTAREMETLRLVAQGLTNDEIANTLVISERTVRNYVTNILSKLHLANRVQAALYALREGLID